MKRNLTLLLAGLIAALGLFSCSPSGSPSLSGAAPQAADSRSHQELAPVEESRPGLATGWGDEKTSRVVDTRFTRASSKPAGTDVIYYNNPEGIKAMTGNGLLAGPYRERIAGSQQAAGGLVEWGVKGNAGFLTTYKEYGRGRVDGGDRRLVAGSANQSYRIVIKNRCKSTLEIVASVDGLDVMDGMTASFSKRGYLIDPGATLEIDGFRTSTDSVAAFKFSSVANSYANLRHGDTRNVGVIGIAVFTQKGVNPWTWMPMEVKQRGQARAFAEAP